MTRWIPFLLIAVCATLTAHASAAAEFETLAGLKGFYVSSVQSFGVPKTDKADPLALQRAEDKASAEMTMIVQGELKKAGIRVFTQDEFRDQADVPSLQVSETTILDEFGTRHTALRLEVHQLVAIYVNRQNALATTWSRDRLVVQGKDAGSKTRGAVPVVNGMLEELISDYRKANPQAAATPED
jgi:hypothetical protein